jgi:DNA repair protein RadC
MQNEDVKGHRERLRNKFMNSGMKGLHDYEALELLLTYAIPRRDVKPIAKALLKKFETLAGVFDASMEELLEIKGIAANSAAILHLVKELCGEYLAEKMQDRDVLDNPEAVYNFARMKLAGLKHETFMVIYLDVKNRVKNYEILHEGTVDRSVVYPRNIIKKALACNAAGLILIHNHPSGFCEPSGNDLKVTKMISDAVETINIKVLDHIIVGRSGYFSFQKKGLI